MLRNSESILVQCINPVGPYLKMNGFYLAVYKYWSGSVGMIALAGPHSNELIQQPPVYQVRRFRPVLSDAVESFIESQIIDILNKK